MLAEGEGLIEGGKGDDALRPCDCRGEGQPDFCDDAVGAPGVDDFVDGFAFMQEDLRLGFHGDDFNSADGVVVAECAVGDGADAAGASAEEAADGGFNDGGGITSKLPALLASGGFECAEFQAGFADGDAFGGDLLKAIHAL